MKDPSFPLYPRDWLTATRTMSPVARAAYFDLICHSWLNGPLPDDPEALRRVCSMDRDEFMGVWPEVQGKLTKTQNNQWVSERLENIREERRTFFDKQKANGSKGGRPRTRIDLENNPNETQPITQTKPKRNPRANPNHNPKKALLSASASASAIASSIPPISPKGDVPSWWVEWLDYRRERKLPAYREATVKKIELWLSEQPDPKAVVDQSIRNGWQGLFELKSESRNGHPKPPPETILEKAARLGVLNQ